MLALTTNTTHGRWVHDVAARLLEQLGNPSDELLVSDVIALAELRWRADQLRRDPNASALDVVRIEGLVDRRTRKLGLDRRGKREEPQTRLSDLLHGEPPAQELDHTQDAPPARDVAAQDAPKAPEDTEPTGSREQGDPP
jgi:hypothetical protein